MTPVRSSMAEVLLCLKRDSSDGMDSSSSEVSEDRTDESHVSQALMEKVENLAEDIACNCKKSKCLKLYCQCFAGQIVCNPLLCKCTRCANTPAHGAEREEAVKMILERNPAAFDSKFKREASDDGTKTAHKTGCRCRKSMCLKKYCECFHAGVPCSASCTCLQCSNQGVPPASTSTSLVAIPARQSTTNPSTVVSTATKRSPPLDSTPEAAAVMRAAQDLALLRNKDGTRITTATATPTTKSTPIHSQRLSSSPLSFMTAHVDTTKPTDGSNNFAQTSSLGHMMTPIDDNESNSIRKRVRSDSPVNEHGNSTGNDRPPSILSRGGATSGRQKSPPLSSSSASSKTTTRLLVHPSSQAQPPADVSFCDLGMLAGGRFKRQAPPTLRISSASPNSLYCASALSLLSGRDMSPQTPGTSSTVKHYLSTGSFFATSPAPYQGASTDKSSNESNEKKRKTASGETTQDFELSDALHRSGSGVRRPHSSSMDNTSEEDSTSISDSPYSRDLPPPTGSAIPPMIVLPPDSADSSKLHPHEAFSSEGMYSSNTNNSNMSHFQKGAEYFNDGNWTKPVVDVLGNMS